MAITMLGRQRLVAAKARVVLITNIPAPYRLPALRELAQEFNLTVVYAASIGRGSLSWEIALDCEPFNVVRLDNRVVRWSRADLYPSPKILYALWRHAPDVVITGGFSFPTLYALMYCALGRVPMIVFGDGNSYSERNISAAQRLVRRIVVRVSAGAIAASEPARRRFIEIGYPSSRVHLSLHTMDIQQYWNVARSRAREDPRTRFLFVGRLVDGKGLDELIAAFATTARCCPGVSLTIVGSGPLEMHLRRRVIADGIRNVRFRGFVDQDSMPSA
ncbi:MAG: glycosyltransferase, partial [Dehalococcoidia bacterium]